MTPEATSQGSSDAETGAPTSVNGATVLTADEIRSMLALHAAKPKWNLEGSTLADVATSLDISVEAAAQLYERAKTHTPENVTPRSAVILNYISMVLSFVGVFVASVLSMSHLMAKSIPCGEDGGCDIVASSSASMILGFPVAYLGVGGYVLLAAISTMRAMKGVGRTIPLGGIALAISGVGAIFSLYLQYISFTQIHALCLWCLTSAITMSLLFLTQAAIAQTDIPQGAPRTDGNGLIVAVGLFLLLGLGLGFERIQLGKASSTDINLGIANNDSLVKLLLTPDSMRMGPEDAPIKVVDFSDLVCPSCRAEYPEVKKLVQDSNGKIQVILRHRPLVNNPDHQMAFPAAVIAEYAASKGKGWDYVDAMYNHDNSELQTEDSLLAVAKEVGIEGIDLKKMMQSTDPNWIRVNRDLHTAQDLKVIQTPTFIIMAKGVSPQVALGSQLFTKIKEPAYQQLINAK